MEFAEGFQESLKHCAEKFGAGLAILMGAVVAYFVILRGLKAVEAQRHLPAPLMVTLQRVVRWTISLGAVVLLLQSLGVLQSVFTAVTGVFALVAIGFVAVWSVLSNTLCSLILLIARPFRVGDTLSFPPEDWGGKVVNFNMLFTTLETEDGGLLQVPNNIFFQRTVLRKKGRQQISLGDQLYREEDARLDPQHRLRTAHFQGAANSTSLS